MKYPKVSLLLAAVSVCIFTSFAGVSEARIGEGRDTIERRMFASGGIVYRDAALQQNRAKGMPYLAFLELLPSSTDIRVYFKTADGRRPTSSDLEERSIQPGWDVHVVYVGGKSAIEVYKRSQPLSEYELNQLLALQANGSFWKKVEKDAVESSAFGYEMVRDDGNVRAKKLGADAVLFVDARTDAILAETKAEDLLQKAPVSVEGF